MSETSSPNDLTSRLRSRLEADRSQIEETAWGVELLEMRGDRYVALPAGTPVRPAFTVKGRPYLKLSRE